MARQEAPLPEARREYLESRTRDYTRFTSLLGESLGAKVDLLAQVLGSAHEPSLGRYKERLLADAISSFIPRRYEVGNGFVLFPQWRHFASEQPPDFDHLNSSDFTPSRQCDIIVYDSSQYPVVFRDGDFVIVRPESVRAVVEVKGSLSPDSVSKAAAHMIDLGKKWQACRSFYRELHERKLHRPFLAVMTWRIAVGEDGRPRTTGRKVREQLVRAYSRLPKSLLPGFPVIDDLFLYNDFEVSATTYTDQDEAWSFGFITLRGRAVSFSKEGEPRLGGDKTVNSLLAGIHYSLETPYNRFFSRADQTRTFPHEHEGYTPWLTGDDWNLVYAGEDRSSR